MAIRLSGLNSGMDTESIISALVSAKSIKIESVKKEQTKLSWKQEAWKNLNTKILNLYNNTLSKMRFSSNYAKKTTSVSNSNAVSVVTGGSAVNSVQSLRIDQLAKTAYLTGGKVESANGSVLTSSSKISEIKGLEAANGTITLTSGDGKSTDISINAETKISDVLSQLQNAGLNATFDSKNQRFFVSAKESGLANNFTLTAADENGAKILNSMGLSLSLDDDAAAKAQYTTLANAYVPGDTAATIANLQSMYDAEISLREKNYASAYTSAQKAIEESEKTLNDLDEKYKDVAGGIGSLKSSEEYKTLLEDANKKLEENNTTIENLNKNLTVTSDGEGKAAIIKKINDLKAENENLEKTIEQYNTEKSDIEAFEKANASIAEANTKLAEIDANTTINVDANGDVTATAKDVLKDSVADSLYKKAEYASNVMAQYNAGTLKDGGATKIDGQDAGIYLNNAKFESNTNTFEINGLTFNCLQETGASEITVTTKDDTDGIYDMIKDFLKEYNTLINEMDKLYNADSASSYKPLTSEEKEAMTEKEIEDWENKIKDSLLRRDTSLNSIASAMKSVMSSGVEINGTKMYLSSFGINTLSYFNAADNERNAYHINGDPDDGKTAGNADVLKSMIANDPETVTNFFVQLSRNLYSSMTDCMKSTSYSSAYTAYEDKKMIKEYSDYTTKIKDLEEKLADYEDRYYKQFTAMEKALANLSSKQSAISGLLGGS